MCVVGWRCEKLTAGGRSGASSKERSNQGDAEGRASAKQCPALGAPRVAGGRAPGPGPGPGSARGSRWASQAVGRERGGVDRGAR